MVAIADGDTLTVLDASHQQHKIRLAGIDALEKGQPFGDSSKQSLAAMAFNKNVTIEWNKLDRYRRTVGKLMVSRLDAAMAASNSTPMLHKRLTQIKSRENRPTQSP